MIVGLFLIGLSFHLHGLGHLQGWVAAGSLILYVGAFAIGLGPVFWLLISEIYPLQVRGLAMSVASLTNWGFNLLVTVSFLTLVHVMDILGVWTGERRGVAVRETVRAGDERPVVGNKSSRS